MIRAVIIDDEKAGIETLTILAARNAGAIKVLGTALRPEQGIEIIEDYRPDAVFLDISMPAMNGFDMLDKLKFRDFKLVFTTAYREYAIRAIKHKAFDYLLKPVSDADFRKCIEEIAAEQDKNAPMPTKDGMLLIEIPVKDGIIFLKQKDIIRLEAARSYTDIFMDDGTRVVASKTLRDFEGQLDGNLFYRCHKSHIINLHKVKKFVNHDGFYALMSDRSQPEISKSLKSEFLERLKAV